MARLSGVLRRLSSGDVAPSAATASLSIVVTAPLAISTASLPSGNVGSAYSATLAATVFMLGGPVSSRLSHVGIICAYALFPIALLLMESMIARRSMRSAIGFGVVAALIILGRNQVSLLMLVVLAALGARALAMQDALESLVERYAGKDLDIDEWDIDALRREIAQTFAFDPEEVAALSLDDLNTDEIGDAVWQRIKASYEAKEQVAERVAGFRKD